MNRLLRGDLTRMLKIKIYEVQISVIIPMEEHSAT
jgi:hypothetical protein